MHTSFIKHLTFLVLSGFTLFINACAPEKTSLFNPDFEFPKENPVISAITPVDGYLAGVDDIAISGEHFSTSADSIRIYFNGNQGVIHDFETTSLTVTSPAGILGDSVEVVVSTIGAEFFSNVYHYKLTSPTPASNTIGIGERIYAPFYDANGNLTFYLIKGGTVLGFFQIDKTTGVRTQLYQVPANQAFDRFISAFIGPDGVIHGVRANQALTYKVIPADGQRFAVGFRMPSGVQTGDMLFHNNFAWVVGSRSHIMRFEYNSPATRVDYLLKDSVSYRKIILRNDKFYLIGRTTTTATPAYDFIATVDLDAGNQVSNYQEIFTLPDTDFLTRGEIAGLMIDENETVYVSLSNEPLKILSGGNLEEFYNNLVGKNITTFLWTDSSMVYTLYEPSLVPEGNNATYDFRFLDMYNLKQYK